MPSVANVLAVKAMDGLYLRAAAIAENIANLGSSAYRVKSVDFEAELARAAAAGLDPTRYAGHSLRAGFVTAAARAGADVWKIQQVSRHRSVQVLGGYVRDARLFEGHAGDSFL